jgi:hypothetical protein
MRCNRGLAPYSESVAAEANLPVAAAVVVVAADGAAAGGQCLQRRARSWQPQRGRAGRSGAEARVVAVPKAVRRVAALRAVVVKAVSLLLAANASLMQ